MPTLELFQNGGINVLLTISLIHNILSFLENLSKKGKKNSEKNKCFLKNNLGP
jgi:hypothetical protein